MNANQSPSTVTYGVLTTLVEDASILSHELFHGSSTLEEVNAIAAERSQHDDTLVEITTSN